MFETAAASRCLACSGIVHNVEFLPASSVSKDAEMSREILKESTVLFSGVECGYSVWIPIEFQKKLRWEVGASCDGLWRAN